MEKSERLFGVFAGAHSTAPVFGPASHRECMSHWVKLVDGGADPDCLHVARWVEESVLKRDRVVTFRCSAETYAFLRNVARRNDWTVSHLCHVLVSDFVADTLVLPEDEA